MNRLRGLAPANLCFGLCLIWKAFVVPFTSVMPGYQLLQAAVPLAVLLVVAFGGNLSARIPAWTVWLMGACGCVTTAFLGFAVSPSPGVPALPLATVQAASAVFLALYALFFIMWAEMYADFDIVVAGMSIGGSYVLASAGYFAFSLLDSRICLGLAIAMPLMSSWALLHCRRGNAGLQRGDGQVHGLRDLVSSRLFPWRTIVAISAVSLAAGFSRVHTSTWEDFLAVGLAGTFFAGFVLRCRLTGRSFGVYQVLQVSFVVMVATLLAGIALADSWLSHLFVGIGQTLSSVVLVLVICDGSHRFGLPAVPMVAVGRSITATAFILGGELGGFLQSQNAAHTTSSVVYLVATAVVTVVACAYWMHRPGASDDEAEAVVAAQGTVAEADSGLSDNNRVLLASLEDQIRIRSEALAAEYGLSRREAEVLSLLAWGKSAKRIEEILTLSPNTVKTHVRHVYAKLGIHSRAELDALLFNATRDGMGE